MENEPKLRPNPSLMLMEQIRGVLRYCRFPISQSRPIVNGCFAISATSVKYTSAAGRAYGIFRREMRNKGEAAFTSYLPVWGRGNPVPPSGSVVCAGRKKR